MGHKRRDVEISLADISATLGISSQRLGQIEAGAFRKIRLLIAETDDFPLLASIFEHTFDEHRLQDSLTVDRIRNMRQKSVENNRRQRAKRQ